MITLLELMQPLQMLQKRPGYYLTFWRLGDYYRTYPEYVEDETVSVLKQRNDFMHGGSIRKPFVVEDGNLITTRYPEDAHLFAQKLLDRVMMNE